MKNSVRTDLAFESKQLFDEDSNRKTTLDGVVSNDYTLHGCNVNSVEITNKNGESALKKPVGKYVTVDMSHYMKKEPLAFENTVRAIAEELSKILCPTDSDVFLIAGLGNSAITADSVGPYVLNHTVITRHLKSNLPQYFGQFRSVSGISPGVLGTTGIESADILQGIIRQVSPTAVIVIDALASRSISRLCSTVQISNTGIVPGSGVGNARDALNEDTLGVKTIAVGVPTVVSAQTLVYDLCKNADKSLPDFDKNKIDLSLVVTPKEIDSMVRDASKVIGYGINLAIHPNLSIDDINSLLS